MRSQVPDGIANTRVPGRSRAASPSVTSITEARRLTIQTPDRVPKLSTSIERAKQSNRRRTTMNDQVMTEKVTASKVVDERELSAAELDATSGGWSFDFIGAVRDAAQWVKDRLPIPK